MLCYPVAWFGPGGHAPGSGRSEPVPEALQWDYDPDPDENQPGGFAVVLLSGDSMISGSTDV